MAATEDTGAEVEALEVALAEAGSLAGAEALVVAELQEAGDDITD